MRSYGFTKEIHDCKDEEHNCRDESCAKDIHDLQRSERVEICRNEELWVYRNEEHNCRDRSRKIWTIAEMRSCEKEIHDLQRSEMRSWGCRDEEL
ncbi:hypothetical protein FNV43_RR00096 [Rhamnella rubrinervis]|uniref:Uncharacterized protein n=1 Tax=Rhamnella rubrinervis TaxID=2594499 RepID=A0A8K0MR36_9ROSA|nr:hypothetical protein FNV43_RR00096 [Rhamnella rubrinervis]